MARALPNPAVASLGVYHPSIEHGEIPRILGIRSIIPYVSGNQGNRRTRGVHNITPQFLEKTEKTGLFDWTRRGCFAP